MIDGRGMHNKIKSQKIKESIKRYIEANPGKMKKDVCKALKISPQTLRNHLKQIEAED